MSIILVCRSEADKGPITVEESKPLMIHSGIDDVR
jgi:hypothetical protein